MIIVGVDGSESARAAVEWAADDAFRAGLPLRLVHAVDRSPYQISKYPGKADELLGEGARILREAAALAQEVQPTVQVATDQAEGVPAAVLLEQARDATELVVGSRGRGGFAGLLLGSVSEHVAGHARCPVVVVPFERRPEHGEVVVGVDDSPECEPALAYAFEKAARRGATVRAVHAWQVLMPAMALDAPYDVDELRATQHEAVGDKVRAFRARHPQVPVIESDVSTPPVEALVEASTKADLLVVGSHGRGALVSMLLGSVSRGALRHARCPVAVVRA